MEEGKANEGGKEAIRKDKALECGGNA